MWDAMGISGNSKQAVYTVENLKWYYIDDITWGRLCSSLSSDYASRHPIIFIAMFSILLEGG